MAVTAEELREWAAKTGLGDSEVEHRVIASRQYYAAYHRCRRAAKNLAMFTDAGGAHAQVIDALARSQDMKLKSVGYKLRECRNARAQADYEIEGEFTLADAATMRERCESIWTIVERKGDDEVTSGPQS